LEELAKRKIGRKYLAACIILILILSIFLGGCGGARSGSSQGSWEKQREVAANYLLSNRQNMDLSSPGSEWPLIAIIQSGVSVDKNLYEDYYQKLCSLTEQTRGVLDEEYPTTYARASIALSLIGKNPEDVKGYNLMIPIDDAEKVLDQGTNSAIYALIASNVCGIKLKNEDLYLDTIINTLNPGGDLESDPFAVDYYGMALQALTYYKEDPKAEEAIEYFYDKIKSLADDDGGFGNCESTAQVIMGLSAIGKDATKEDFLKGGKTPVDELMQFATEDGFKHDVKGKTDIMASEQALRALNSVAYVKEGKLLLDKKQGK
jgi:hypothetical protein